MLLSAAIALVLSTAGGEIATDVAAPSPSRFDVFPPAGSTLPLNGRLLVAAAERVLVTHDDGRVEDLVPADPAVYAVDGVYLTVTPSLTDGEVITLEAVCGTCAGMQPLSWVVGRADRDAPAFTEPTYVEFDVDRGGPLNTRAGFGASFALPLNEPVVVDVVAEDVAYTTILPLGNEALGYATSNPAEREVCITVTATDVAGNVGEPHDVCIDLVDDGAGLFDCSQGSASSTLGALSLLVLLRRRRRR